MRELYSFFVRLYTFLIYVTSPLNEKARQWKKGRNNWKLKLKAIDFQNHDVYWFHCASLGEFEQGRPLIEMIKQRGNYKILLTFFSPSGYELQKNYKNADWVLYLPSDTLTNAQYFVAHVEPKAVFFIKYEFWFNFLHVLQQKKIKVFLVSGVFRENQHFFKWYGQWFARHLSAFDYFFVQNQLSLNLLGSIGYQNAIIAGDTRFDRVLQIKQQNKRFNDVELFIGNAKICVAGSTYLEDEQLLAASLRKCISKNILFKLIVAPHELSENRLLALEKLFNANDTVRFSKFVKADQNKKVLIIDNIGMLSSLYNYATLAYIGGGFGKGIHNSLEAAVYGRPLIFGHNFQKFEEAKALVKNGAAFVVNNEDEIKDILIKFLLDEELVIKAGQKSLDFVHSNQGSVNKILNLLLLKNIIK
ncbi:MAG TPA: glycosyltransferase N-terminal domain-containing protein [Bacteroidia bacterium]|nr:glycosyltransferase N-terminal domain-containing protein [Bacteroidia bacterium]